MASTKTQPVDNDFSARIEARPDILAGEPVLKGTRIAARYIAELVAQGSTSDEIVRELDITREQIDAALVFDRVIPASEHPPTHRLTRVPPP